MGNQRAIVHWLREFGCLSSQSRGLQWLKLCAAAKKF
jgi:hypothetical protein